LDKQSIVLHITKLHILFHFDKPAMDQMNKATAHQWAMSIFKTFIDEGLLLMFWCCM